MNIGDKVTFRNGEIVKIKEIRTNQDTIETCGVNFQTNIFQPGECETIVVEFEDGETGIANRSELWPQTIEWQDQYTGELVEYHNAGAGNYPYDCKDKDKYPDAIIYRENSDGTGSWLHSEGLKEIRPGVYESSK